MNKPDKAAAAEAAALLIYGYLSNRLFFSTFFRWGRSVCSISSTLLQYSNSFRSFSLMVPSSAILGMLITWSQNFLS